MIYQTDNRLPGPLQKYGCAFVSLCRYREKVQGLPWTAEALGAAWNSAIASGYISGDLNHDGDLNDAGEATIQDWGGLAAWLGLKLRYLGKYPLDHPTSLEADKYVLTSWINPANWFVHWVVGGKRPVEFDPIGGGSVTVRMGHPYQLTDKGTGGLRVFQRLP